MPAVRYDSVTAAAKFCHSVSEDGNDTNVAAVHLGCDLMKGERSAAEFFVVARSWKIDKSLPVSTSECIDERRRPAAREN